VIDRKTLFKFVPVQTAAPSVLNWPELAAKQRATADGR